jgi:hypothetical protein
MYQLLSAFIILLFSCDSSKERNTTIHTPRPTHKNGSLSLFVHVGFEHQFTLVVNDTLKYSTTYPGATDEGPQILINVIPKTSPIMKFKIHMVDRDTTFSINVQYIDSLRFGLFANNNFMISNEDQHVWFYD